MAENQQINLKIIKMEIKIENDYIGWLETNVFIYSYSQALEYLFNQLKNGGKWGWIKKEYPKSEFNFYIQNGVDKYGDNIYIKIENFKMAKLRKLAKFNIKL
jgi:hypothetical protein